MKLGDLVSLLGVVLTIVGAWMALDAHWLSGYASRGERPPAPWDNPQADPAGVDMLSRVAPGWLVPEAIMMVIALAVGAWVWGVLPLWRWLR